MIRKVFRCSILHDLYIEVFLVFADRSTHEFPFSSILKVYWVEILVENSMSGLVASRRPGSGDSLLLQNSIWGLLGMAKTHVLNRRQLSVSLGGSCITVGPTIAGNRNQLRENSWISLHHPGHIHQLIDFCHCLHDFILIEPL